MSIIKIYECKIQYYVNLPSLLTLPFSPSLSLHLPLFLFLLLTHTHTHTRILIHAAIAFSSDSFVCVIGKYSDLAVNDLVFCIKWTLSIFSPSSSALDGPRFWSERAYRVTPEYIPSWKRFSIVWRDEYNVKLYADFKANTLCYRIYWNKTEDRQ